MKQNIKIILLYTAAAVLLAAVTSPLPGTSLLLTGVEVFMLVHLAKINKFELKFGNIGFFATALWGVSTVLKDTGVELLRFAPGLGWAAGVIVAVVFVFFLGILANLYFSR